MNDRDRTRLDAEQLFDPEWNERAHDVLSELYAALTGREARSFEEMEGEAAEEAAAAEEVRRLADLAELHRNEGAA